MASVVFSISNSFETDCTNINLQKDANAYPPTCRLAIYQILICGYLSKLPKYESLLGMCFAYNKFHSMFIYDGYLWVERKRKYRVMDLLFVSCISNNSFNAIYFQNSLNWTHLYSASMVTKSLAKETYK